MVIFIPTRANSYPNTNTVARPHPTPADQDGLPSDANTGDEVMDLVNQSSETDTVKMMKCISAEGQFQLYLLQAQETDQSTSEAEHRCIWDGIRQIVVQAENGRIPVQQDDDRHGLRHHRGHGALRRPGRTGQQDHRPGKQRTDGLPGLPHRADGHRGRHNMRTNAATMDHALN